MREVICINIGQAGIQIANAAWELFCIEHGVEANGLLKFNLVDDDSIAFRTFFYQLTNGQYVPRCLSLDLEPSVLDEVRRGVYRNLFHPDYLINEVEDGCSNYARGHFTIGKRLMSKVSHALGRLTEQCQCLQGFFIHNSAGGGTGGGLTSLVQEFLSVEYAKYSKYQIAIFPSPILSVAVVEPYNTMMSLRDTIDSSDVCNIFNNEGSFEVCTNLLDIERPTYSNINRLLAQLVSDITVSLRFESSLNSDLSQLGVNLIPYPRIHYITASHSPIASQNRADHEKLTTTLMTKNLFRSSHQLVTCDVSKCIYMACIVQYRGDINPQEVGRVLSYIKKRKEIKFVDWCPTGFKIGINVQPPSSVKGSEMAITNRSSAALVNSDAVVQPLKSLLQKFDVLFTKRSFIHWFVGEGMEEGEFNEARDEIQSILVDYEEICVVGEEGDYDDLPPPPGYKEKTGAPPPVASAPVPMQKQARPADEEMIDEGGGGGEGGEGGLESEPNFEEGDFMAGGEDMNSGEVATEEEDLLMNEGASGEVGMSLGDTMEEEMTGDINGDISNAGEEEILEGNDVNLDEDFDADQFADEEEVYTDEEEVFTDEEEVFTGEEELFEDELDALENDDMDLDMN